MRGGDAREQKAKKNRSGRSNGSASGRIRTVEALREALHHSADTSSVRLGRRLLDEGLIGETQLERALRLQQLEPHKHLGEILVELGWLSNEDVHRMLWEQLGIPVVDLQPFGPDQTTLRMVPRALAHEHKIFPLCLLEGKLVVAAAQPWDTAALQRMQFVLQMPVVAVAAPRREVEEAIHSYLDGAAIAYSWRELDPAPRTDQPGYAPADAARVNVLEVSVAEHIGRLVADALAAGASAIFLDASAGSDEVVVRFRRDGRLGERIDLPRHLQRALLARLKKSAGIPSDSAQPREGHVRRLERGPADVQLRIVSVPTHDGGEHLVVRLIPTTPPPSLESLGMSAAARPKVEQLLARPAGLLLVAGPAGSGRSTTARAMLALLDTADIRIWSAEKPVNASWEGVCQVEVGEGNGRDYPAVLSAILRAEPDVLLVGELRDRESSALAVETALRGARVIAGQHASGTADAVTRLLAAGVDPFSLSDALTGVLAQRLVRKLCLACRVSRPLMRAELDALVAEYCRGTPFDPAQARVELAECCSGDFRAYDAPGCELCGGSGYSGMSGLFELMPIEGALADHIRGRHAPSELAAAALRQGMRTLRQDGIRKALAGVCDLLEVRAATA